VSKESMIVEEMMSIDVLQNASASCDRRLVTWKRESKSGDAGESDARSGDSCNAMESDCSRSEGGCRGGGLSSLRDERKCKKCDGTSKGSDSLMNATITSATTGCFDQLTKLAMPTAAYVGAGLGFLVKVYMNALRKMPLTRRELFILPLSFLDQHIAG
jgi:hypothetical protein